MAANNSFSIDIALHHPSCSPKYITTALSLKPLASLKVRERTKRLPRSRTHFYATLAKGDSQKDYEKALRWAVLFIEKNASFWREFASGRGEVELILNHQVLKKPKRGDRCLQVHLSPEFLRRVSALGIGLRVQGWA
jgi:hypothetical protein